MRRLLARQVRAVFQDDGQDQTLAPPSTDGLFAPGSIIRDVHGDVTTMMIGGIAALLLQMLHPLVLAGVWDHSRFRDDMRARLGRTARFIAVTTYGARPDAEAAIARVRAIHARISGTLPDGTPYRADDPALLEWVHVTETLAFLEAYRRHRAPGLSPARQNAYVAQMSLVGERLGVADPPRTLAAARARLDATRPRLSATARSRKVAGLVLEPGGASPGALPLSLVQQAAIDLLPAWARTMHGLRASGLTRPLVAGGVRTLARTLRWALAAPAVSRSG